MKKSGWKTFFLISALALVSPTLAADELTPLEVFKERHEELLKRKLGTNSREVLEDMRVRNGGKPRPKRQYPYEKVELPGPPAGMPKWDFDLAGFNKALMARIVANEDALPSEAVPDGEDPLPYNPTIRLINAANEKFAVERLDAAKFPRCDDLLNGVLDAGELKSGQITVKCWHIRKDPDADLYLAIVAYFDGAWQVRDYLFLGKLEGGSLMEIIRFDELPAAEVARVVYGVYQGVPEAYNNLAIIALKDRLHYSEKDVEGWFKIAAEKSPAARRNLYRLYLNIGEEAKARELGKSLSAAELSALPSAER